jgi:hypothetical protein
MNSDNTNETQGTFQRYAQDSVGKALDQVTKGTTDVNHTTNNETNEAVQATNTSTQSTNKSVAEQNHTPSFEEFANAELNNETITSGESYKGLNYDKVVGELSDDAQKLLANFRSDYTRKTQELARERKALEEQRKALLESDFAKNIKEKAEAQIEFDPFDDASVQAKIEQEVARRMQDMLTPMQQQYELQQNQMQLEKFKAENPDLDTYRTDVAKLLLQNENLSLQQAYFIVKGQKQNEKSRQLEEELNQYKSTAKEYGLLIGGSSRPSKNPSVPNVVREKGAFAIYQWLAANKSK